MRVPTAEELAAIAVAWLAVAAPPAASAEPRAASRWALAGRTGAGADVRDARLAASSPARWAAAARRWR